MKSAMMVISLAGVLAAGGASAQSVAALVGDDTIVVLDAKAMTAAKPMKVSGIDGQIVGIDVRPADGMLYGLLSDGTIVTIDTTSGKAARKSKLDTMLPSATMATVDFNPAADRLRVIGSDGTNLRANVDDGKVTTDGKLKFAEADMHKGATPKIVAGAYTNSVKGAKETVLFDIDAGTGTLVKQAPPNDGILNAVGKLGVDGKSFAFDIVSAEGANAGWLLVDDGLYKVDLTTGKATSIGKLKGLSGSVRDIAALPGT
ncbi:lipoprotein [Chelatococcus reniformis]|uniref:Lipoprotein n=2 Tax=Chelatococcus reniformis TaxID=1494448 RepID=A0A916U6F2_9HYPH|nr:lipoprotein [Chelatococcus reniformis]